MGSISLEEFENLRDSGLLILDNRPTNDFAKSHINNSINASINGSFEYMASCFFNKDEKLVIVCNAANSAESFLRLESEGYTNLHIFHYNLWNIEKLSLERVEAKNAKSYVKVMKDVSNIEDYKLVGIWDPDKSMAAVSYLRTKNVFTNDIIGGLSAMLTDAPDLEI